MAQLQLPDPKSQPLHFDKQFARSPLAQVTTMHHPCYSTVTHVRAVTSSLSSFIFTLGVQARRILVTMCRAFIHVAWKTLFEMASIES